MLQDFFQLLKGFFRLLKKVSIFSQDSIIIDFLLKGVQFSDHIFVILPSTEKICIVLESSFVHVSKNVLKNNHAVNILLKINLYSQTVQIQQES